jgi:ubiquinone/menaquinone biosynthesis C-methylase UbiE
MIGSRITSRWGLKVPFDHFDLIAGLYNRSAQFSVPAKLVELLALPEDGSLLDAGGGTGRVTEAFSNMVRGRIIADPSRGMLRLASEKGLAAVCAPAEKLPFASNTFDGIIMVDAFHHVNDQAETVRELWRVLSPGGRVVIIEPDISKFIVKVIAAVEKLLLMRSHFLSAEKISALFTDLNIGVGVITDESNIWVHAEKVR